MAVKYIYADKKPIAIEWKPEPTITATDFAVIAVPCLVVFGTLAYVMWKAKQPS